MGDAAAKDILFETFETDIKSRRLDLGYTSLGLILLASDRQNLNERIQTKSQNRLQQLTWHWKEPTIEFIIQRYLSKLESTQSSKLRQGIRFSLQWTQ